MIFEMLLGDGCGSSIYSLFLVVMSSESSTNKSKLASKHIILTDNYNYL